MPSSGSRELIEWRRGSLDSRPRDPGNISCLVVGGGPGRWCWWVEGRRRCAVCFYKWMPEPKQQKDTERESRAYHRHRQHSTRRGERERESVFFVPFLLSSSCSSSLVSMSAVAAALQGGRALAAGGVGRRVASHICFGTVDAGELFPGTRRRKQFHMSAAYDKNPEEQVRHSSAVPDDVIQLHSDKYWAPHPKTGVFGPAEQLGPGRDSHCRLNASLSGSGGGGGGSALDQTAWFRPVDGVDKPQYS